MSLDKFDAIPVDTHVWRIAKRDYGLSSSAVTKSLTAKNYKAIGDKWREIFGEYAGWAQSLLFSAEIGSGGNKSVKSEVVDIKEEVELVPVSIPIKREDASTTTRRKRKKSEE
ncbi:UNVERIFIED_CONTAM: 8-oxoguanine glycosylase ogg1 [Siphonaria sp. JEL0065]|nr:8-oxoguanine glycosylase ogg1 [Siphonaria sp. JEL0065]